MELLRFPSWDEFLEKEEAWEKHIHQKIKESVSGTVKDHPMVGMAIEASFAVLPPPLNGIAQSIYNNAKGSDDDRLNAVLRYFEKLKEEGQKHYELVANKIDSVLVGIQDLSDIGDSILKIQEILVQEIKDIDLKLDNIKTILKEDHNTIMRVRWEKEKSAFAIGEGLITNIMSSYSFKEQKLTQDRFFDLCTNIGIVNLDRGEINAMFNPSIETTSKIKFYYTFCERVGLMLDTDLRSALGVGENFALLRETLSLGEKNVRPTIMTSYQNLMKRRYALNKGGVIHEASECLIRILTEYLNSTNNNQSQENQAKLLDQIYECVSNIPGSRR